MTIKPAVGLLVAGFLTPGARICESPPHGTLMAMASRHARYQARHNRQGHQQWSERRRELARVLGSMDFKEICAESWTRQSTLPLIQIGQEMFKCWQQSEGHWSVVKTPHKWFGYDMHKSESGIWYACIITAD